MMFNSNKEKANVITHGIGLLLFLVLIPILICKVSNKSPQYLIANSMFCLGLLFVYFSSTIYHLAKSEKIKKWLRIFDHSSIYLLIAGTQTPLIAMYLEPQQAYRLLSVIWLIVLGGLIFKLFFTGRYEFISILSYLILAFCSLFALNKIFDLATIYVKMMLLLGGASYLIGIIFYVWKKYTYHHAIWHVFVLAGSLLHYASIYYMY